MINNFGFYLDQIILTSTLDEGVHAFLSTPHVQLAKYLSEQKMPQTKVVEKNNTFSTFNIFFAKVLEFLR